MGMDLVRRRDSIKWQCSNQLWIYIIDSAQMSGWKPLGIKYQDDFDVTDPLDYYTNNGQTVTPEDSENLHLSLVKFIKEKNPKGIEKEIIKDLLNWLVRRNDDNSVMDIPGFIIR